ILATVVSVTLSAGCVAPALTDRTPFTIATGGAGGVYHPVGNAICRVFNLAEARLTRPCLAVISDGSAANIERIRRGDTALGLSLELGLPEQNRALCANSVDAIMFQAAQPSGFIQEATIGCPARLLRLEGPAIGRLLSAHPYDVASVIPGGMYEGNPSDVPTFGTQTLLVTSARQSEDVAYAVVKAVVENFADFRRLHPALSTLKIEDVVPSSVVTPI